MPLHQLDDNRVTDYSADYFLSGALVTNADNVIVYVNTYFKKELHWHCNELIGKYIDKILTKSSKIFLQSYVLPTLIHEKNAKKCS